MEKASGQGIRPQKRPILYPKVKRMVVMQRHSTHV